MTVESTSLTIHTSIGRASASISACAEPAWPQLSTKWVQLVLRIINTGCYDKCKHAILMPKKVLLTCDFSRPTVADMHSSSFGCS